MRCLLHQRRPDLFPYGYVCTPIIEIAKQLLRSDNVIAPNWFRCIESEEENNRAKDLQTCVIQCFDNSECTTATCLQKKFVDRHPSK